MVFLRPTTNTQCHVMPLPMYRSPMCGSPLSPSATKVPQSPQPTAKGLRRVVHPYVVLRTGSLLVVHLFPLPTFQEPILYAPFTAYSCCLATAVLAYMVSCDAQGHGLTCRHVVATSRGTGRPLGGPGPQGTPES